jgi:hypothetical protein
MNNSIITAAMLDRRTDILRALCAKAAGDAKMVKFNSVLASEKASKGVTLPQLVAMQNRVAASAKGCTGDDAAFFIGVAAHLTATAKRTAGAKAPRVLSFKQRLVLAINAPGRVVVESLAIREARELQALTVRAAVYAANHPRGRAVFLPTLRSFGGVL